MNTTDDRTSARFNVVVIASFLAGAAVPLVVTSCHSPSFTSVDLNVGSPMYGKDVGMPYYLPKPYLVVTKNIRYIPTPTVGLTQTVPIPSSFDASFISAGSSPNATGKQASASTGTGSTSTGTGSSSKSTGTGTSSTSTGTGSVSTSTGTGSVSLTAGSLAQASTGSGTDSQSQSTGTGTGAGTPPSASSTQVLGQGQSEVVPAASIPDGITPDTFYTYQFVMLPDLGQKYGLRVKGGTGEMRATFNIVNGWMFTGPGPVYMRDSSKADTATAAANGVAQVTGTIGQTVLSALGVPGAASTLAGKAAAAGGGVTTTALVGGAAAGA